MPFQRIVIVALGLILSSCSGGNAPPPPDPAAVAKAAVKARAAKEGALYDQMRQSGSWDIAVSLGNEILVKYPGTQTAARVQQTIAETREKSAAIADSHRLARLWTYTATAEDYNEPGRFTALIGYEWTSNKAGNNLHRVVIFRDGKD